MKRSYITLLLLAILSIGGLAAQGANPLLDKTASQLQSGGGIKATFMLVMSQNGLTHGAVEGEIALEGDKFKLSTPDAITYFDGKNQWSYLANSDEVTVTQPTAEELQTINPYMVLQLYKKGYNHKMGSTSTFGNQPIYEVILESQDKKNQMSRITLYIAKDTSRLLYIQGVMQDGTVNDIAINDYQEGQKFPAGFFVFDKKKHPTAEVIDLR